ncbi:MAG: response regulator [Ignavibacteriales bacterium]|nr:response regulator [Ignavibacteriales bacterium]
MILVVERDETMRHALAFYLESLGFIVHTALNGLEAVQIFSRDPKGFRVVFLDLDHSPGELVRLFTDFRVMNADIKFIAVYGFAIPPETLRKLPSEAIGFIAKPFEPNDILFVLRRLLGGDPIL